MAPSPVITVTRGRPNTVNLRFRVGAGFHVNSNKPKSEFLIPTVLKLSAPTDIVIGRVTYPAGTDMSFAFAPEDKLSVYTGEFPVAVDVRPLAGVVPARYMIRGELRYQACDKAACYPPKSFRYSLRSRSSRARRRIARIQDKARTCTCKRRAVGRPAARPGISRLKPPATRVQLPPARPHVG